MKTSSTDPDDALVTAGQLFRRLRNALASGAFVTATAVQPTTRVRARQRRRGWLQGPLSFGLCRKIVGNFFRRKMLVYKCKI